MAGGAVQTEERTFMSLVSEALAKGTEQRFKRYSGRLEKKNEKSEKKNGFVNKSII